MKYYTLNLGKGFYLTTQMNRCVSIVLLCCFACVGMLFFASGYLMSRGLIHATLPQYKKRESSLRVNEVLSTDYIADFSEEHDTEAFANLETLSGLLNRKITRKPSSNIDKKKLEPLLPGRNIYVKNPYFY
jgi:hypothetical protein